MSFFHNLNKRLADLAAKQDAAQLAESKQADHVAQSPLTQALNEAKADTIYVQHSNGAPQKVKLTPDMKAAGKIYVQHPSGPQTKVKIPADAKKSVKEEDVAEADYSAKKAAAGKDIGKPGKNFAKIAKSAGAKYGSKAAGERVAGAVLNKLRHPKEDIENEGNAFTGKLKATPKGEKFKLGDKTFKDTSSLEEGTCPSCDCSPCKCDSMEESALQAYLGDKKYGKEGMKALQKAGREHAGKTKMDQIRNRYDKMDEADMEEGNEFSGNLAKAKAAHKSEFEVDGKTYPVKEEKKKAKPDYIDLDGDGDRKESMKKAAADKKRSTGTAFDKEHMDKLRKEKEAETHSRYDVKDTGYSKRYTRKHEDDVEKDDEVKSDEPKKKGRPKGPAKGPERTTKGAWKHKGERKTKTKEGLDSDGVMMTRSTNCSSESIEHGEQAEYNDEAGMAKDSLHTIVRHARELERALRSNENLPEWVQEKIGQIKGMMSSVTDYIVSTHERDAEQATGREGLTTVIPEKAVSKAQRKFMGMAHAIQKGERIKGASPELKKVAKSMNAKDTHDFAATKEKGLPEKVKAKKTEVEETTVAGSVAPVQNAAPKAGKGMQFGKGVYEGFNTSVESMITESMNISVNMNAGEDGQTRKSITVTAEGQEADQLAALLKMAGLHGQSSESCGCGNTPCSCDETVEEAYGDTDETLNKPDWPTDKETLEAEPELRTYSGGLNGPKSTGQTTVPVVASQLRRQASMEESVELERSLFKTWKNYKG